MVFEGPILKLKKYFSYADRELPLKPGRLGEPGV
jgi:hypothetical protein